jgi:hypothetical protein
MMPRLCKICTHPARDEINRRLIAGDSQKAISGDYGMSGHSVSRHSRRHLPELVAAGIRATVARPSVPVAPVAPSPQPVAEMRRAVQAARVEARADNERGALDVLRQATAIHGAALSILHRAQTQNDPRLALQAIGRAVQTLELFARCAGDLNDAQTTTVNVLVNPQWITLKTAILGALERHPDAKREVIAAVTAVERNGHPD